MRAAISALHAGARASACTTVQRYCVIRRLRMKALRRIASGLRLATSSRIISAPLAARRGSSRPPLDTTMARCPSALSISASSTAPSSAAPASTVGTTIKTASARAATLAAVDIVATPPPNFDVRPVGRFAIIADRSVRPRRHDIDRKPACRNDLGGDLLDTMRQDIESPAIDERNPAPEFLHVGCGRDMRKIAVRRRIGAAPGLLWLGGLKSDMAGTKAVALDQWAAAQRRSCVRFDYSGHGES